MISHADVSRSDYRDLSLVPLKSHDLSKRWLRVKSLHSIEDKMSEMRVREKRVERCIALELEWYIVG